MGLSFVLISNNPAFLSLKRQDLEVLPVSGIACDVVIKARDLVHRGWILLNHPLYGNFRPYQQPFRTMLLRSPKTNQAVPPVDRSSLTLVENAISVYMSCQDRWIAPDKSFKELYEDCSVLDYELMKETLQKEGLLS